MKQSTQPAPAPRRPRSVKRTILFVVLGLLLVAVALLAIRIYRTATQSIVLVERQPSRSAAVATNSASSQF